MFVGMCVLYMMLVTGDLSLEMLGTLLLCESYKRKDFSYGYASEY